MQSVLGRSLRRWIPFAVSITVITGLVDVEVQQDLRQSANDPQIQMAEDTAARLAAGADATVTVPMATVDIASSLAPFLIVYDSDDHVVASSAMLDGVTPHLPEGVLEFARERGEDRVTWEPREGVRIATVVVPYRNGSVLAGRSLREVEARASGALGISAVLWLFGLVAVAATILAIEWIGERGRRSTVGRVP